MPISYKSEEEWRKARPKKYAEMPWRMKNTPEGCIPVAFPTPEWNDWKASQQEGWVSVGPWEQVRPLTPAERRSLIKEMHERGRCEEEK